MIKNGFKLTQSNNTINNSHIHTDFSIIRCGYRGCIDGKIYKDTEFTNCMQEFIPSNQGQITAPIGIYFFSQAITEQEALEEAKWVLELIAPYPNHISICYCCRGLGENRMQHINAKDSLNFAFIFLNYLHSSGYPTLLEINESLSLTKQQLSPILEAGHNLWLSKPNSLEYYLGLIVTIQNPITINK